MRVGFEHGLTAEHFVVGVHCACAEVHAHQHTVAESLVVEFIPHAPLLQHPLLISLCWRQPCQQHKFTSLRLSKSTLISPRHAIQCFVLLFPSFSSTHGKPLVEPGSREDSVWRPCSLFDGELEMQPPTVEMLLWCHIDDASPQCGSCSSTW